MRLATMLSADTNSTIVHRLGQLMGAVFSAVAANTDQGRDLSAGDERRHPRREQDAAEEHGDDDESERDEIAVVDLGVEERRSPRCRNGTATVSVAARR